MPAPQTTTDKRAADKAKPTAADGTTQEAPLPTTPTGKTPGPEMVIQGPETGAGGPQMGAPTQPPPVTGVDGSTVQRALDGDPEAESTLRKFQNRVIDPETGQPNMWGLVFPDLFDHKRQLIEQERLAFQSQALSRKIDHINSIEEDVLAGMRSLDPQRQRAAIELGTRAFMNAGMDPERAALKMRSLGATEASIYREQRRRAELQESLKGTGVENIVRHIQDPDLIDRVLASVAEQKGQTASEQAREELKDRNMRKRAKQADKRSAISDTVSAVIRAGMPIRDTMQGITSNPKTGEPFQSAAEYDAYVKDLIDSSTEGNTYNTVTASIRDAFGLRKGKATTPQAIAAANRANRRARKNLKVAAGDTAAIGAIMDEGSVAGGLAISTYKAGTPTDDIAREVLNAMLTFERVAATGSSDKALELQREPGGLRSEFIRILVNAGVPEWMHDKVFEKADALYDAQAPAE